VNVYPFIEAEQAEGNVTKACALLEVSRSAYYQWRQHRPSPRQLADADLGTRIQAIFEGSRGTYGWPRVHQALRREGNKVPAIMLTARNTPQDKIHSLELGADDYLAKPFSPRELLARVKATVLEAGVDGGARLITDELIDVFAAAGEPGRELVELRAHPADALDARDLVEQELLVVIHVGQHDLEQIVGFLACDQIAGLYLGAGAHLLLEVGEALGRVAVHGDLNDRRERQADPAAIDQRDAPAGEFRTAERYITLPLRWSVVHLSFIHI